MKYLTDAQYIKEFVVRVTFNSGETAEINLESHLNGEVFEPLRRPEAFALVKYNADIETISWPNGADFSPDFLFSIAFPSNRVA
jgi:hypothetical protein